MCNKLIIEPCDDSGGCCVNVPVHESHIVRAHQVERQWDEGRRPPLRLLCFGCWLLLLFRPWPKLLHISADPSNSGAASVKTLPALTATSSPFPFPTIPLHLSTPPLHLALPSAPNLPPPTPSPAPSLSQPFHPPPLPLPHPCPPSHRTPFTPPTTNPFPRPYPPTTNPPSSSYPFPSSH